MRYLDNVHLIPIMRFGLLGMDVMNGASVDFLLFRSHKLSENWRRARGDLQTNTDDLLTPKLHRRGLATFL